MATVVVCDDDPVARAAITVSCEEAGLEVVAETDSGSDAAELVRRFGVDVLVLDLSLADGSGERTLEALTGRGHRGVGRRVHRLRHRPLAAPAPRGAGGDREARLRAPRKPCSRGSGTSVDASVRTPDERRLASREVSDAPPLWRSPAGVSSHHDLTHSLLEHGGRRRRPRHHGRGPRGARGRRRPAARRRLPPRRRRHPARRAPRPGPAPRGPRGRRLRRRSSGAATPGGRCRVVAPHRRAADARRCRAR